MKRNRLYLALPIIILLLSILILLGKNYYWFVRGEQIYTKIYANHPDFACSEESESDLSVRVDMMTAVDFYKAALRGPFPTWRAWYRSGQAYCRLGEYELAQSAFESFLAQNPSALGQIELGFVNVHLQNMAQAVKYWKQGFLSEEDFLQAARNNFDLKEYLQSAKWYLRASYFGRDYASSIAYLTYLDRSAQDCSAACAI